SQPLPKLPLSSQGSIVSRSWLQRGASLMDPNASPGNDQEQARGLPTVVPPSGKFIAQLFLVPLIIVASVFGFLLFVNWLVGSVRSPSDFLNKLDSPNADVRWRAA